MSGIWSEITRHAEKQKNMINSEEENQLIKTHPELTQTLKLAKKNIKTIVIIVFHNSKS